MNELVLKTIRRQSGDGTRVFLFACGIFFVLGGFIYLLNAPGVLPVSMQLIGVFVLICLFKTEPTVEYIAYMFVDAQGITYHHTPGESGRISRYQWHEISEPELSSGDDVQGLAFKLQRPGLKNVPVCLPITSESDCVVVLAEVRHRIKASANQACSSK